MSIGICQGIIKNSEGSWINTALESMGCAPFETIVSILPYLDTYLMDIKHMDPEKHQRFTGRSNELMLENAKRIAAAGMTDLVIRVPVIPTFNCTKKEIQDIAVFAGQLQGVRKIHLLAYHRLGQDKYEGLGRKYELEELIPPSNEEMEELAQAVRMVSDLDCQIGG